MKASIKCPAKENKGGNKTKEEGRRKSDHFLFVYAELHKLIF